MMPVVVVTHCAVLVDDLVAVGGHGLRNRPGNGNQRPGGVSSGYSPGRAQ
jgi:hypothetical protein